MTIDLSPLNGSLLALVIGSMFGALAAGCFWVVAMMIRDRNK